MEQILQDNQDKIIETRQKAALKAVSDFYVKYYKQKLAEDPVEFFDLHFPGHLEKPFLEDYQQKTNDRYVSNKQLSPQDTVALMVTFSPDPKHQLGPYDLAKFCTKICKPTKGVSKSIWTIEQRGSLEVDMGTGPHFHLVIVLNKNEQMGQPSRQTTRITKMLEKYQTATSHFLDIKRVSEKKLPEKWDYIKGIKNDDKNEKVQIDYLWREQLNIPHYTEL